MEGVGKVAIEKRREECENKLSLLSCSLSLDSAFSLLASMHAVDPSTSLSLFTHQLTDVGWTTKARTLDSVASVHLVNGVKRESRNSLERHHDILQ
jgi:hypothetical protein